MPMFFQNDLAQFEHSRADTLADDTSAEHTELMAERCDDPNDGTVTATERPRCMLEREDGNNEGRTAEDGT